MKSLHNNQLVDYNPNLIYVSPSSPSIDVDTSIDDYEGRHIRNDSGVKLFIKGNNNKYPFVVYEWKKCKRHSNTHFQTYKGALIYYFSLLGTKFWGLDSFNQPIEVDLITRVEQEINNKFIFVREVKHSNNYMIARFNPWDSFRDNLPLYMLEYRIGDYCRTTRLKTYGELMFECVKINQLLKSKNEELIIVQ